MISTAEKLRRVADSSPREDESEIPLGELCREAGGEIERLQHVDSSDHSHSISMPARDARMMQLVTFDAWFADHMQNADGDHTHLPEWLRGDMRSAWDAGAATEHTARLALEAEVAALTTALEKIAGSHLTRVGYCITDMDEVPDYSAHQAMNLARKTLDSLEGGAA